MKEVIEAVGTFVTYAIAGVILVVIVAGLLAISAAYRLRDVMKGPR